MQTCDVDTPPDFPRLGMAVTVQSDTVAAADDEDVRVINDVATTVSVCSESLESDHVPGVYPRGTEALVEFGYLWITVVVRRCLWTDGFTSSFDAYGSASHSRSHHVKGL